MGAARIVSGASLSTIVDTGGAKTMGVAVPSGWATADLTFQTSADGVTFQELHDDAGVAVTAKAAAGKNTTLDKIGPQIMPWRYIKIRSGTAALGVNQEGNAAAKYIFNFGSSKTLTITSGVKGSPSNGINFVLTNAANDTLAVSKVDSLSQVTIALANTTGSKNAAATIETAVQALSTVGGIDISSMTVAGSTEYDAAPPVRSAASRILTFGGKTLTFTSGALGPDGNEITLTLETAANDTLAVTNPAGTKNILIKLANLTASKNADTALQTAVRALTAVGGVSVAAMTVSGNAAYDSAPLAPVAASGIFTVAEGKTLTVTSGVKGPTGNNVKVTIGVAEDDILAVTGADDTITILLANETASKNSAAHIQTAVQAISGGTVAGVSITAFTVAGNTAYNSAPAVALGEGIEISGVPLTGGAVTLESGIYTDIPLTGGAEPIVPIPATNIEGGEDIELTLVLKE